MIGNTVDTDLIGEVVEVVFISGTRTGEGRVTGIGAPWTRHVFLRGRVRAVTPADKGMVLWLHIFDEECLALTRSTAPNSVAAVDDIVAVPTYDGTRNALIHLIREGQKP
jgi:hypothetical protein